MPNRPHTLSFRSRALSWAAAVVLTCAAIGACWLLILQQKERNMRLTQQLTEQHLATIEDRINEMSSLNLALASAIKVNQGSTDFFADFARELMKFYPDLSHLSLAPDAVVSAVFPLAGNTRTLNLNLLTHPPEGGDVAQFSPSNPLSIAGPVDLIQGRKAVLSRMAVYLDTPSGPAFWGFTHAGVDLAQVLQSSQLHKLNQHGYFYQLSKLNRAGQSQLIDQNSATGIDFSQAVSAQFSLAGGHWQLAVIPQHGWIDLAQASRVTLVILLINGVIGYLVFRWLGLMRQRKDLRRLVVSTTDQLEDTHATLRATLDAIPDFLFEVDSALNVRAFHSRQKTFLDIPAADLLNQTLCNLCGAGSGEALHQLIDQAQIAGSSRGRIQAYQGEQLRILSVSLSLLVPAAATQSVHFLLLCRDITQRVADENELRIAATAFETYNGMMVTDASGKILRTNKAFSSITGYSAEQVLGRTPNILSSGLHDRDFYSNMWRTIHKEGRWQGEIWNRRAQGDIYPEWLAIAAVKNSAGEVTHYVSTLTDISTHKEYEKRIENLSFIDELTQLANRNALIQALDSTLEALDNNIETPDSNLETLDNHQEVLDENTGWSCLLHIDLKNFKFFNENRGQHMGDLLLRSVANRLADCIHEGDILARLGSDNFAILLRNLHVHEATALAAATQFGENLLDKLNLPYRLKGEEVFYSATIGAVLFNRPTHSAQTFILQAEQAANFAKAQENTDIAFFSNEIQEMTAKRFTLVRDLRVALQQEQFQLYFQPQVNNANKIIGAEALVRWLHPKRGFISPAEFIPAAEASDLIFPLGQWILQRGCEQLVHWSGDARTRDLSLSINMSARQFKQDSFVDDVLQALHLTGANPSRLILELTESMLVDNQADIILKMSRLKAHGIRFSLDDFGTGYSSLAYLKRLPINELKIDQSFVKDVLTNSNDAAIARMIIGLAKSMELMVIAEGVEYQEHRDWLKQQGCDSYQGYYFGKPVTAHELLNNMYL